MESSGEKKNPHLQIMEDTASEWDAWFAVSGDMDDFIYFGDLSKEHSEK